MTAAVVSTVARGAAARGGATAAAKGTARRSTVKARASKAATSTTAQRQRQQIEEIKAARPAPAADPVAAAAGSESAVPETAAPSSRKSRSAPAFLTDQRGAPAVFRTDGVKAANVGGGFVLGALAHVVALAYLRGGKDGVKRLLRAKFFNIVTPA